MITCLRDAVGVRKIVSSGTNGNTNAVYIEGERQRAGERGSEWEGGKGGSEREGGEGGGKKY